MLLDIFTLRDASEERKLYYFRLVNGPILMEPMSFTHRNNGSDILDTNASKACDDRFDILAPFSRAMLRF